MLPCLVCYNFHGFALAKGFCITYQFVLQGVYWFRFFAYLPAFHINFVSTLCKWIIPHKVLHIPSVLWVPLIRFHIFFVLGWVGLVVSWQLFRAFLPSICVASPLNSKDGDFWQNVYVIPLWLFNKDPSMVLTCHIIPGMGGFAVMILCR